MAYEKKTVQEYITETEDETVEGFNDNQETRIKAGFNKVYPSGATYSVSDFIISQEKVGNKSYVQYNSGRMTQTTRLRVTLNTDNSIGTMYHSWGTNLTFEKYFTNVPDVTYSVQQESGGSAILRQDSPPGIGTAAGTYSFLSPVSANITATIIVKGEGEWK